jgi:hypothetical protein
MLTFDPKVDELKTSPGGEFAASAPELAARALDRELNAPNPSSADSNKPVIVNDLTKAVKKKRKAPVEDDQMTGATTGAEKGTEPKRAKTEEV